MSFFRRRSVDTIGSDDPAAVELGRYLDAARNTAGEKLRYGGGRSVLMVAPNRAGKGSRFIINNLLSSTALSALVVDPRGEAAAVTGPFRSTLGPVRYLSSLRATDKYSGLRIYG